MWLWYHDTSYLVTKCYHGYVGEIPCVGSIQEFTQVYSFSNEIKKVIENIEQFKFKLSWCKRLPASPPSKIQDPSHMAHIVDAMALMSDWCGVSIQI